MDNLLDLDKIKNSKGYLTIEALLLSGAIIGFCIFFIHRFSARCKNLGGKAVDGMNDSQPLIAKNISNKIDADNSQVVSNTPEPPKPPPVVQKPPEKPKQMTNKKIATDEKYFTVREEDSFSVKIVDYHKDGPKDVVIPSELYGKKVVAIGENAFYKCGINSVEIPNTVKTIEFWAFRANNLTRVSVPNNVNMHSYSFDIGVIVNKEKPYDYKVVNDGIEITNYNNGETEVNIPSQIEGKNVVGIGDYAFSNKGLTSVTIPKTVKYLGRNAFSNNKLTKIHIPSNIKNISKEAFFYNNMTDLQMDDGIEIIGESAFCSNHLKNIRFSNTLKRIEESAFYSNDLTSISLPNSLNYIAELAFYGNNISSVRIPFSTSADGLVFDDSTNIIRY